MDKRRTPLIAGNWKMNASINFIQQFATALKPVAQHLAPHVDIALFPTFVHLPLMQAQFAHTPVQWGAQNLYLGNSGAFTGEVAAPMLKEFGCRYVLIGH